jgi:transcription initiation factor IIE alpha subunit
MPRYAIPKTAWIEEVRIRGDRLYKAAKTFFETTVIPILDASPDGIISNQDIAAYLGIKPRYANRKMVELEECGFVEKVQTCKGSRLAWKRYQN